MAITVTATVHGWLTLTCSACPQVYKPHVNDRAHYIADWVWSHTQESHVNPRDDFIEHQKLRSHDQVLRDAMQELHPGIDLD